MALGVAFLEENGHPNASAIVDDESLADQIVALSKREIDVFELAAWLREALTT